MSSFDKTVKLACKPKAAAPKPKYLDPIIAATWSEEGAVHDVCKALAPRLREPNTIVVFKALIVLHTMIRNGSTDNVLSYLSSSEVLRLRNISSASWEGYTTPENLQHYGAYLDSRIKAYGHLKHDAIRVQADTNRDMRNSAFVEDDSTRRKPASSGPTRSKTITGRKLRVMTVEKGLLRETKAVHKMIDALVECRFYLDDLEDELIITALRMLVKDLLILFQAGNEGVINLLEHYFEMSHIDAKEALGIYRHFCKQTEHVVEYLGVAKKLQNLLNVPIPNLKHAPVSLAGALQEYLDDPNFEQNRIEYKANKEAADRSGKRANGKSKGASAASTSTETPPVPPLPSTSTPAVTVSPANGNSKDIIDFFAAIEQEQPTMFNPQTNSPSQAYFQQQAAFNPFMQNQMTGMPPMMGVQQTGFLPPQPTGMNPFGLQPQPTGHRPFSSFLPNNAGVPPVPPVPPLPTGFGQQSGPIGPQQTGFLQPQQTGYANPFRQSVVAPQTTGMALFGVNGNLQPAFGSMMGTSNSFDSAIPPGNFNVTSGGMQVPPRPSSTPLTSVTDNASAVRPVKSHQTGTNNPFGRVPSPPPPPVPRQPTLFELAASGANHGSFDLLPQIQQQQQQQPSLGAVPTQSTGTLGAFGFNSRGLSAGGTDMSSIASSFTQASTFSTGPNNTPSNSITAAITPNTSVTQPTTSESLFSTSSASSSIPTLPIGNSAASMSKMLSSPSPTSSASLQPLQPQTTGFVRKPFKPSSSFGATLLESLPPIPGSAPTTPAVTGTDQVPSHPSLPGFASGSNTSLMMTSMTTSSLRPQMTQNGGPANPFRASMAVGGDFNNMGTISNGNGSLPPLPFNSGGLGVLGNSVGGTGPFGFSGATSQPTAPQNGANSASLI